MLRKIFLMLLCTGTFFSSITMADNHMLMPGVTMSYELPPNNPQEFSNFLFWTINAKCTVETPDEQDILGVKLLKKNCEINGAPMHEGEQTQMCLRNRDVIYIMAPSGAKVELTNRGQSLIKAICST